MAPADGPALITFWPWNTLRCILSDVMKCFGTKSYFNYFCLDFFAIH